MNLTTRTRYAVMAMVDLAQQSGSRPVALAEIAKRQDIAQNYLEQIFMKLRKAGLVQSVRGPGGGYRLCCMADSISIAAIVDAVDEPMKMMRCHDHLPGGCLPKNAECKTHSLWEGLSNQISSYLQSVSLADVCQGRIDTVTHFHNSQSMWRKQANA